MDTIFVKHIRENGPAVKAGLSTGKPLDFFFSSCFFFLPLLIFMMASPTVGIVKTRKDFIMSIFSSFFFLPP